MNKTIIGLTFMALGSMLLFVTAYYSFWKALGWLIERTF